MLVVGGGDSALEAALACAEAGAQGHLSYRGEAFNRLKPTNRARLDQAVARSQRDAGLAQRRDRDSRRRGRSRGRASGRRTLSNDAVIVCAGGVLPTELLRSAGITFETKHGQA